MSNLFVVTFNNESGAEKMLAAMTQWQKEKLIKIDDAAVVVRRLNGQIKIRHAENLVGKGSMGGSFWKSFVDRVLFKPETRARGAPTADTGLDPYFVREISEDFDLGMSAIFAYTQKGVVEKILPQLKQFNGKLIKSSINWEDEAVLKKAFIST
jgi:uncharacterized membrane protein